MLAVEALSFGYRRGAGSVIEGLSHEFAPGTVTAISGESGSGKSTLLYILGLMLKADSGRLLLNGNPMESLDDRETSALRASRFGFVFQDAVLDPARSILDSVIEPALYAGSKRVDAAQAAQELLDDLGVGGRATHKPGEVSGGQAQRVAVCRALINDPPIILADEPTGNLDRKNAASVLDLLATQATEHMRIVVIATHDPFVLQRADHILEL